MKRILSAVAISVSLAAAPLMTYAAGTPDATIDISANKGAIGVGYVEGKGTLHFQGQNYPVSLQGLTVGEVGWEALTATGEIYNLTRVDDLNGNYIAVSAGAALGGGAEGTAMQNQNGVVVKLHGTTEGADVNLSIDGFALKVAR